MTLETMEDMATAEPQTQGLPQAAPASVVPLNGSLIGPSPVTLRQAPDGYGAAWSDVARAAAFSVIRDPALHFALYGHAQGRAYLTRLGQGVRKVILIAPSYLKQCGIGEYGRYLASQFQAIGAEVRVERTSAAVLAMPDAELDQALVLVNHGPGLFDGLNPRLSQGESTATLIQNLDRLARDKGAVPVIIHHSLLDTDHHLLFSRQAQILNAPVAQVSFVSSGARHFFMTALELGLSPVDVPEHAQDNDRAGRAEAIGFFGFFQYGGKDFDALIHLARELRAKLVGSVATVNPSEADKLREILDDSDVAHDFSTGWITDAQLMNQLIEADYFYLPQNDYDHWNNSATARFVTQIDRPLFLPPHHPFLDMADGSIFATKFDLPRIAAAIREPGRYARAVERVRAFRKRAAMVNTARALKDNLPALLAEMGEQLLLGPGQLSCERWLELSPAAQAEFRAAMGNPAPEAMAVLTPAPWRVPAPLQFWRKHYELGDLVSGTVLESIHATYLAICKRPPSYHELHAVAGPLAEFGTPEVIPGADLMQAAIRAALEARGGPFHEPEIVMLDQGLPADWESLTSAQGIAAFAVARAGRRATVAALLEASDTDGPDWRPQIRNLVDLLLLPPADIRRRHAVTDVSALDFDWIHQPRRLQDRLNRLLAAASEAGIALTEDFVFDLPIPDKVMPRVLHYAVQDFIHLDGDLFILQAVRALRKRDPLPIEGVVMRAMIASFGKRAVLRYGPRSTSSPGSTSAPLRAARARITEIDAELAALGGDERARAREIDLLRFQVAELDAAASPTPTRTLSWSPRRACWPMPSRTEKREPSRSTRCAATAARPTPWPPHWARWATASRTARSLNASAASPPSSTTSPPSCAPARSRSRRTPSGSPRFGCAANSWSTCVASTATRWPR